MVLARLPARRRPSHRRAQPPLDTIEHLLGAAEREIGAATGESDDAPGPRRRTIDLPLGHAHDDAHAAPQRSELATTPRRPHRSYSSSSPPISRSASSPLAPTAATSSNDAPMLTPR